jgi:hypothetical protein
MSNPNVADISVLEGLQAQANAAMGCQPVSGNAVFNVSGNVQGILMRLPKFKVHYDNALGVQKTIDRLEGKKHKDPKFYGDLLEKSHKTLTSALSYPAVEAKNIATLIDLEKKRLGFNYQPGSEVVKEGVDPDVYRERKEFADAVNAFYSGTLPDGTRYTDYLK